MIQTEAKKQGIEFAPFDGEALEPVTGYWKSQDVYRWESVGIFMILPEEGSRLRASICGWSPMRDIVRSGGVKLTRYMSMMFEADPV